MSNPFKKYKQPPRQNKKENPFQKYLSDDRLYMVGNVASYHFEREGQNEKNIGLGVEKSDGRWRYGAGVLKDSYGNWSPYAGAAYLYPVSEGVSLGPAASLMYRQKADGNRVSGLSVAPMLQVEMKPDKNWGLNLNFIPPVQGKTGGLVFLQYKRAF